MHYEAYSPQHQFAAACAHASGQVSDFLLRDISTLPLSETVQLRNTALDWLFYDVGSLTEDEFRHLYTETHEEGSIIVVHPRCETADMGVRKFENYQALRRAKGKLLKHFCIAGVGSSDVGAAALARNVADFYREPVGAIVAGYGVVDLLAEALVGWFVFGAANRLMKAFHDNQQHLSQVMATLEGSARTLEHSTDFDAIRSGTGKTDSDTLLRLLLDEDRTIKTLVGHSKGCLSIAFALEALVLSGKQRQISKAKAAKIITMGAVVELPNGFDNSWQFLGALDWFGGLNSRFDKDHIKVPGAWHHLNPQIPMPGPMCVRQILGAVA